MIKRIVIILLLIYSLLPIPLFKQGGVYNTLTGLIWCKSEKDCLHEIAHKLDDQAKWISNSDEFYNALQIYLFSELATKPPSKLSIYLIRYSIKPLPKYEFFRMENSEIYAIIFVNSDGQQNNMPPIFRKFYNWDLAQTYINKYVR